MYLLDGWRIRLEAEVIPGFAYKMFCIFDTTKTFQKNSETFFEFFHVNVSTLGKVEIRLLLRSAGVYRPKPWKIQSMVAEWSRALFMTHHQYATLGLNLSTAEL